MRYYDTSPDSAETYFNHSIFGQLYTLIAETLGSSERRRPTHERLQDATVPSNPDAPRRTLGPPRGSDREEIRSRGPRRPCGTCGGSR